MKIVLRPRKRNVHGQDYRSSLAAEKLQLTPVCLEDKDRKQPVSPSQIALAVTFDPENRQCLKWIDRLPVVIPVVSHFQLQWNYLSEGERDIATQTIRRSSAVVVPAEFLKNDLSALFPGKRIECIVNGANQEFFRPTAAFARTAFRKAIGLADEDLLIIHVGPITGPKGDRILYEFYKKLPDGYHLLIYCRQDAASAEAISHLNEIDAVRLHVLYDQHQIAQANHPVRFSDAMLSCSLGEAAPMSVIEALLSGVPVIATKSTPFFDELKGVLGDQCALQTVALPQRIHTLFGNARTLDPDEQKTVIDRLIACAESLQTCRDDERQDLSSRMAQAGFTADAMLGQYEALYKSISDE